MYGTPIGCTRPIDIGIPVFFADPAGTSHRNEQEQQRTTAQVLP